MSEATLRHVAPVRPDVGAVRIPPRSLELLGDLVAAKTGMSYDESRLHFFRDRITPLVLNRGFDSLLDYFYLLKYDAAAEDEWLHVIDALAVQETYFWREFDQVRALVQHLVPAIGERRRTIRIWSFPCASGEEPLSIAMALTEAGCYSRFSIEVRGSDASPAALQRAAAGRYSDRAFRQLPDAMRDRYFSQTGPNEWTVCPELQRRVTSYTRANAVNPEEWGDAAVADVIFCRNLFIYFDQDTVQRVVAAFAARMCRPGYLFIAAAESLLRLSTPFSLEDAGGAFVYVIK